jgi:hypothetical protein
VLDSEERGGKRDKIKEGASKTCIFLPLVLKVHRRCQLLLQHEVRWNIAYEFNSYLKLR